MYTRRSNSESNKPKSMIQAWNRDQAGPGWEENELLPQHQLKPPCLNTKVKTESQKGRQGIN